MSILEYIGGTRILLLRHIAPEGGARILLEAEYENQYLSADLYAGS